MDRFLRPHLYAARPGRDLVLLDVRRGRYDLLAGAGPDLSIDASGRRLGIHDNDLDAALVQAALFVAEADFEPTPALPLTPRRSVIGGEPSVQWRDRVAFASAWGGMIGGYYGRDLPALLQRIARSERAQSRSAFDVEYVARAFHQLSPWAPFAGDCVFRCFMLLRALTAAGAVDVRWVFGVRTWPFYAHCWLQRGETTLTDHAEPLVSFTPIFAC